MFVRTSARADSLSLPLSLRIYRGLGIQMRSYHPAPFSARADLPRIPLTQHAAGMHTPREDLVKYVHRPGSIETRVYTHARAHTCRTRKFSLRTREFQRLPTTTTRYSLFVNSTNFEVLTGGGSTRRGAKFPDEKNAVTSRRERRGVPRLAN